jgi:hypothetical protein
VLTFFPAFFCSLNGITLIIYLYLLLFLGLFIISEDYIDYFKQISIIIVSLIGNRSLVDHGCSISRLLHIFFTVLILAILAIVTIHKSSFEFGIIGMVNGPLKALINFLQSFECKIFTNVELVKLKYDLEFLIETSS